MACLTEAMHFAGKTRGSRGRDHLWRLVVDGRLEVYSHTAEDLPEMRRLMEQYRDLPMDLADASLVVLGSNLSVSRVFTLDAHFHAYRLRDGRAFTLSPSI